MSEKISVVIPVFNGEKSLESLNDRLINIFDQYGHSYEIIFINDGSEDNSWQKLKKIKSIAGENIVIINLMRNFGQHNALLCGFNNCHGDLVITMDDDLQHPPEELPILLDHIKRFPEIDVVIGVPEDPKKSFIKRIGSIILNIMISKALGKPKDIKTSPLRVIRKRVVENLKHNGSKTPAIGAMLFKYTKSIENVLIKNDKRQYGKSGYSLRGSVRLFLNYILNYSNLPFKYMSFLGFITSFSGFVLAIWYLFRYIIGAITIPGWTILVILVLILGGLILLSLGIIGEYLFRVIGEVNHSPQFIIKEKIE